MGAVTIFPMIVTGLYKNCSIGKLISAKTGIGLFSSEILNNSSKGLLLFNPFDMNGRIKFSLFTGYNHNSEALEPSFKINVSCLIQGIGKHVVVVERRFLCSIFFVTGL